MLSGLLSQPASGFSCGFLGKPAQTTPAATGSTAAISAGEFLRLPQFIHYASRNLRHCVELDDIIRSDYPVATASQAPTFGLPSGFSLSGSGSFATSSGGLGGATVGSLTSVPSAATAAVAGTTSSAATTLLVIEKRVILHLSFLTDCSRNVL